MVGKLLPAIGEFLQADHLSLVGVEQAPVRSLQPVLTGQNVGFGLGLLGGAPVSIAGNLLELGDEAFRVFQQGPDVIPHRFVKIGAVDAGTRTALNAGGLYAILSGTTVVMTLDVPGQAAGDAMHGEAAGAAGQQAAQEVIVLLVVAK